MVYLGYKVTLFFVTYVALNAVVFTSESDRVFKAISLNYSTIFKLKINSNALYL